jgi:hypothetical protein
MDATTGADSRAMAGKFLHSSTRFIMPVEPKMRAGMTRVNGGPATVTPGPVPVSVEPEMPVDYASFDMPSLGPWSHVLGCGRIWIISMLWASTIRVRLQPRIISSERGRLLLFVFAIGFQHGRTDDRYISPNMDVFSTEN